jgi:hypothetical protein
MSFQDLCDLLDDPEVRRQIARADLVLMQADDLAPAVIWGSCPPSRLAVSGIFLIQAPDTQEAYDVLADALRQIKGAGKNPDSGEVVILA